MNCLRIAVIADQRRSRSSADGVPRALSALSALRGLELPFERTAGDEIQALTSSPTTAVSTVRVLARLGDWRVGLGVGSVDTPLPDSTRAARGPAYVAARAAVEASRTSPADLSLRIEPPVKGNVRGDDYLAVVGAETALAATVSVIRRRTTEGWQVVDLSDAGRSGRDIAAQLGISPSAVSQRLARSGLVDEQRLAHLSTVLLGLVTSNPEAVLA